MILAKHKYAYIKQTHKLAFYFHESFTFFNSRFQTLQGKDAETKCRKQPKYQILVIL